MQARWLTISLSLATATLATTATAQPSAPQRGLPAPTAVESQPRGPQGQPIDPAGQRGISPFMVKILKGNAAYAARDFAASVEAYREAIQEDAEHPLGHYMLGQAQLAAGNLPEAEASWQRGLRFAGMNKQVHAKLLFVLADLHERQARWSEAKQRWQAYADFCRSNPEANGYPANADARIQAIDKREDVAKKAAVVKERIQAREKELDAPAQAAKK